MGGYESIAQDLPHIFLNEDEALFRAMVGPEKQDYYLRHFALFSSNSKNRISWNW